ncbi:MAG: insulinase family protein [Termitinemataceae bacterium]|nr:MAG: insulinase family protein [Termitinemataceae bacterium]
MDKSLKKGDVLDSNFRILEVHPMPEIKACGIYAIHEKTKCEVFHVLNDDEENLFAFTFATAPEDSTGVAHIIEHSVLCGSENYPLKDAFTVLCQGSLQTYLNAWTFPDKTVYPASSVHPVDYFNLMAVYGDCVFHPLLDEWTFMQEGHNLSYKDKKLSISGVVYNEMKGAYSALDEYASQWSTRSVLPDTIYALDSGGDPECIPNLTYEYYKKFYKERYSPSNCKIFLAGNIDTEKQLAFINEKFLSNLEAATVPPPVKSTARRNEAKVMVVSAPAAAESKKCEVFVSWVLPNSINDITPLLVLEEILLGHDGSPLSRALTESHLGEDLSTVCGLENELKELVWTVGLRGVPAKNIDERMRKIENLILDELQRLVKDGIPKKEKESAMFSMETYLREIKRSGGPFSLIWLRRSLRGWLHGAKPWETMLLESTFAKLKEDYANDERYFEKMLTTELINNMHRSLVAVKPDKYFLQKKEKALAQKLKQIEKSLSKEQKQDLMQKNIELERRQNEDDSNEVLKKIPHLSKNELDADVNVINRNIIDAGGIPVVSHKLFTNGITYANLAFPIDVLDTDELIYLSFFASCICDMGLPGIHWADVSGMLALNTASFSAMLYSGKNAFNRPVSVQTPSGVLDLADRDWIIFSIKTLDDKIEESLELVNRIIRHADFSDYKRITELLTEMKNDADAKLISSGSIFAGMRASRNFSRQASLQELWNGITQVEFLYKLFKSDVVELSKKLSGIRDKLILSSGVIINLTRENDSEIFYLFEKYFSDLHCVHTAKEIVLPQQTNKESAEMFYSSAMQVGFAALSCSGSPTASQEAVAEESLCHYLSYGPLWKTIRMKGGAYGVHANMFPIEQSMLFTTFRDPNPEVSLKLMPEILNEVSQSEIDSDNVEKIIIGTYAKLKHIFTPAQSGFFDFSYLLNNITYDDKREKLKKVLDVSSGDLKNAARRIFTNMQSGATVSLAGKSALYSAAKMAGIKIKKLPVG